MIILSLFAFREGNEMICKGGTRYHFMVPSIFLHTFAYVFIFFNNPDISVKFGIIIS